MKPRMNRALLGAALALVLLPAAASTASTRITVRIEGLSKTLLASKALTVPGQGSITKGGTPKGACPANTAAGALDTATRGNWNGTFDSKYQALELTSIFGETHRFSSPYYWSVWVNERYATAGICALRLNAGQRLLFAAVSVKGTVIPLVLRGPAHARLGGSVTITAGSYGKGGFIPAKGVKVTGAGKTLTTDKHGHVKVSIDHPGTLDLRASGKGFIRAALLRVREVA